MIVTGLIAEYNPFHNGHAYHIEMAKKLTGADYIVVVMSGDYVQRGTPAMIQKHTRAKMALLGGANLVLELPVNYAAATAETFAYGGVKILNKLGIVDHICFGSECGDASILMEIAEILVNEPNWFSCALKEHLQKGLSYPAARAAALPKYQSILSEPNNILGIEYCKALLRLDSAITPITLKRLGAGYHDTSLNHANESSIKSKTIFASASGIREYLKTIDYIFQNDAVHQIDNNSSQNNTKTGINNVSHIIPTCINKQNICDISKDSKMNEIIGQIPSSVYPILENELLENGFMSEDDFSSILLYKLLQLQSPVELMEYMDMSEELANRIYKQRFEYKSFSQFADLLKTKEVTRTRINRALLHFILELKNDMPDDVYGRILGFRKESTELLSEIKRHGDLPLISKASSANTILTERQHFVFTKSMEASNLYEGITAIRNKRTIIHENQKKIAITD